MKFLIFEGKSGVSRVPFEQENTPQFSCHLHFVNNVRFFLFFPQMQRKLSLILILAVFLIANLHESEAQRWRGRPGFHHGMSPYHGHHGGPPGHHRPHGHHGYHGHHGGYNDYYDY